MKKKRLSLEQITSVLQQVTSGVPIGDVLPPGRDLGADVLPLEEIVRRHVSSEAREFTAAPRGTHAAETRGADLTLDKVMLQDVVQKRSKAAADPYGRPLEPQPFVDRPNWQ